MTAPRYLDIAFVGDVANLSATRLTIPTEVRKASPWLSGTKPIRLIAELLDPGRIRLYAADAVQSHIDEARHRIAETHQDPRDLLAAFADRYRSVTYYPSDSRVHLGSAVAMFLNDPPGDNPGLYVEARGRHIDVMSLERRHERLSELRLELELGAESTDTEVTSK